MHSAISMHRCSETLKPMGNVCKFAANRTDSIVSLKPRISCTLFSLSSLKNMPKEKLVTCDIDCVHMSDVIGCIHSDDHGSSV